MDWSGKKALDYQKQMTNMSASFTFNSEYKGFNTVPGARMHVVEKPNRSKVQRSYSAMLDESFRSFFDTNSSVAKSKHDDTMSLAGGSPGTSNAFGSSSSRKSKKNVRASFLKKSVRKK